MIRTALGCLAICAVTVAGIFVWIVSQFTAATWDTIGWLAMWSGRLALALVVVAGVMIVDAIRFKREMARNTRKDGSTPIIRRRVRPWRDDLPRLQALYAFICGDVQIVDLDQFPGGAVQLTPFGEIRQVEPAEGWERRLAHAATVQQTRNLQAVFPGDNARTNWFGKDSLMPRLPAAALRPKVQPAQLPAPAEDEVIGEFTPLAVPFADAINTNTPTTFALGFANSGIVRWDVESSPHIRVHGQTQGSGKTNVIKTIVAGAIPQGVHVIVLDRRGFKDWRDYRRHVEFIDNRKPGAFSGTMRQLAAIYRERDEMLGQAGASNLADLPGAPARLFVVVSEFGTVCREATATGEMDEALPLLKSIMSEAGATGLHMIFEDQAINRNWPPELRGNADPITGYLPEDAAKAGGYRHAHHLKPYEFHHEGVHFRTWDMKAEAPRLLGGMAGSDETVIDIHSFIHSPQSNNFAPKTNEIIFEPVNERMNEREVTPTELQQLVWKWRDVHKNGTQAELRKEFAQRGIKISAGHVFNCWHAWVDKGIDVSGIWPTGVSSDD